MMHKAVSRGTSGARLRTKTGCFTCRRRRVKCSEEWPYCKNCSIAGRRCSWPLAEDLSDRRHFPRAMRPPGSHSGDEYDVDDDANAPGARGCSPAITKTSLRSSLRASILGSDMEVEFVNHFLDKLMWYQLLPNVHDGFYYDYGACVISMMLSCESVKFSVLACTACNKYMLTNDDKYRKSYMRYYSRAVKEVGNSVIQLSQTKESPKDQLLVAVVYLYVFALWSQDMYADAPDHVSGAMQLLQLRYQNRSAPLCMERPMMRIATESVLYQAFLLYMRNPFDAQFRIDSQFILQTESALEPLTFADTSLAGNSPVLGIPLSLYRLIIGIIKFYNSPQTFNMDTLERLRCEMKLWEAKVVANDLIFTENSLQDTPHEDAAALYILAGSLLLDLVTEICKLSSASSTDLPERSTIFSKGDLLAQCVGASRWQVRLGLSILRIPQIYEKWTRCFLASWPLLIFGYAVEDDGDISLVKQALRDTRQRIGYGEIQRILDELSLVWDIKKRFLRKMEAGLRNVCIIQSAQMFGDRSFVQPGPS